MMLLESLAYIFLVTRTAKFIHMSSSTPGCDWDLCHQTISIRPRRSPFFMLNKQGSDPLPFTRRTVREKVPLVMELKLSFHLEAIEGQLFSYQSGLHGMIFL